MMTFEEILQRVRNTPHEDIFVKIMQHLLTLSKKDGRIENISSAKQFFKVINCGKRLERLPFTPFITNFYPKPPPPEKAFQGPFIPTTLKECSLFLMLNIC